MCEERKNPYVTKILNDEKNNFFKVVILVFSKIYTKFSNTKHFYNNIYKVKLLMK